MGGGCSTNCVEPAEIITDNNVSSQVDASYEIERYQIATGKFMSFFSISSIK